jgi:hypothetical protein
VVQGLGHRRDGHVGIQRRAVSSPGRSCYRRRFNRTCQPRVPFEIPVEPLCRIDCASRGIGDYTPTGPTIAPGPTDRTCQGGRAKLLDIKQELRRRMHQSIPEQGAWLKQVVAGYFAYHAVPTNDRALRTFRSGVEFLWIRSLRKRSQRDRTTWEKTKKLSEKWLPKPRILHPWPSQRFAVKHPRWEPYAGIPPVRFCAGVVSRRRESAMLYGRWRWTLRSRFVGRGFKPP